MSLNYILPRVVRHFLPERVVSFLLEKQWVIKPGLETESPHLAVQHYQEKLAKNHLSLQDKKVMVFGYGGNILIGCLLLQAGAKQIILCERQDFINHTNIRPIAHQYPAYFREQNGVTVPNHDHIRMLHADIRQSEIQDSIIPIDLVLSSSVLEHLEQPTEMIAALSKLTAVSGSQLHFIDLRDHYFKYPFEMLCYSSSTWQKWLDPTSHLNRLRISDYQETFSAYFKNVKIELDAKAPMEFQQVKSRIRPEFLSGDDELDSTTQICLLASHPKIKIQHSQKVIA